MANINLLPWREALREERNKSFYVFIGLVVVLALLSVFARMQYFESSTSTQSDRNNYLKREAAMLDTQIVEIQELRKTRAELIERMELIQALQGNRPVIVRIFDEVARSVPDDLYFKTLKVTGNKVQVTGVASSNNRLSALMRRFDASEWFQDPSLVKVESRSQGVNQFEIIMTRVDPQDANTEQN
ncbi:MAG: PilN domain-containing protein [Thalassolituus sp.]|jgi:type IV pilus assembly protein PilN